MTDKEHLRRLTQLKDVEIARWLTLMQGEFGEEWMKENFAFMAIVKEPEGSVGMFHSQGNGTNANCLRVAHAAIRSLSKQMADDNLNGGVTIPESSCVQHVMNTLWAHIMADLGRDGIPDTIFKALMDTPHTND